MTLSNRDRKILRFGAVALVFFCALKFGLFPLYDTFIERRNEIAQKEKAKEKYLKFLKKQADFEKSGKNWAKEKTLVQQGLLRGETTSLAAADIQRLVDDFAKQSKVEMQRVKVVDSDTRDDFVVIPVQVVFSSDLTRLVKFIRSIEADRKLLTMPDIRIRVKNQRRPQDVSVTVTVAGYMKKRDTKK